MKAGKSINILNNDIKICDEDIRFEYTMSCPPIMFSETYGYVTAFKCKQFYSVYSDEDDYEGEEKLIGKLSGYRFALNNCYYEYDEEKKDWNIIPRDLVDMIDDEVAKLDILFKEDGGIKKIYKQKFNIIDEFEFPNIVFIKRIEILPKYRGKGFGIQMIKNSFSTIGKSFDVFILDSAPLQFVDLSEDNEWNEEMKLYNMEKDKKIAEVKLDNYYKKLGFKKLGQGRLLFLIC